MKKLLTALCCLIALQVTAQQHIGDVRLKTFPPRAIDDMVDRYLGWYGDTVYINPNDCHYLKIGNDLYEITIKSEIIKLDAAHGYINSKDWQTLPGKQLTDTIINGRHILLTPMGKQLFETGHAEIPYSNKQINE